MKKYWIIVSLVFLVMAGCNDLPGLNSLFPGTSIVPTQDNSQGTPEVKSTTEPTSTPDLSWDTLVIWLPPQFDPAKPGQAGVILQSRLREFSDSENVKIEVRIKSEYGQASLLQTLIATYAAAPNAMPSLVALPRGDMETASLKGYIHTLEGASTLIDDPDWYEYARQLAYIQESVYGLPFAGDTLLLAYRPNRLGVLPTDWETVLRYGQPLAFPADDPQAFFAMSLYRSAGGNLENDQHRPMLDVEPLTSVLSLFDKAVKQNVINKSLTEYQTDDQSWQAYLDGRAHLVVTWSSRYLETKLADTSAVPLPPVGDYSWSLTTGWLWTVPDPIDDRRELSIKLAEFLSDPVFLAEWTAAVGYLPTRPSALAAWSDQSLRSLISQVVLTANGRPANDLCFTIGPVLRDTTLAMLNQQGDPRSAAQTAIDNLLAQQLR